MTLKLIDDYLNKKIRDSEEYFVISFFDLRVKFNLSKEDTAVFLNLSVIRLQNIGYRVYLTNQEYDYHGEHRVVKSNELLVAIKK